MSKFPLINDHEYRPDRQGQWRTSRCDKCGEPRRSHQLPGPVEGLWDKRNTPSGAFEAVKRSGDVLKGGKREN